LNKQETALKVGKRGNKKSREEQSKVMTNILSLSENHDDIEVMNALGIPNSSFYRYKAKIYKESRKIWEQICKESLEYRALQTKKSLDFCIRIGEEIALDKNQKAEERMQGAILVVESQINLLKLLKEGPIYMDKMYLE
jgi:hypothetical protein